MIRVGRWLAAIVALALALGIAWPRVRAQAAGVDYYQFWIVGRARATLGTSDIYAPAARERMAELGRRMAAAPVRSSGRLRACAEFRATVETFATPFLYALVDAAASGDYDTDLRRFHVASIGVFVAAVVALCVLAGWRIETGMLAAALLCACSDPLASDVRTGNVAELQLGGLAVFLALRRLPATLASELAAGGVLGALVAVKPTLGLAPVFVAVAHAADRRLRSLVFLGCGALAAGALALALGAEFLGSWHVWLEWLGALGGLERVSDISVENGNFGLARLVAEAGGPRLALPLSSALALAVAASLALPRTRGAGAGAGDDRFEREYFAVAFGAATAALSLELVWVHYYVLLTPLAIFVLRSSRLTWRGGRLLGELALVAAMLGWPARELGIANSTQLAMVYVVAAWLLAFLGVARAACLARAVC